MTAIVNACSMAALSSVVAFGMGSVAVMLCLWLQWCELCVLGRFRWSY